MSYEFKPMFPADEDPKSIRYELCAGALDGAAVKAPNENGLLTAGKTPPSAVSAWADEVVNVMQWCVLWQLASHAGMFALTAWVRT